MNAVEIEEAVSQLVEAPFDREAFSFEFLRAFGQNETVIRKLKSGDANKSDLAGGLLQRNKNNIHLLTCAPGEVAAGFATLRASPATAKHKARFILATDGLTLQAERFDDGEPLSCNYRDLPDKFAYFLSLAGISTVKRIDENAFDIRATGRLNKLYVELLKENPDWDTEARRKDLNHFFARLIFCFFAEDTTIFDDQLFTRTMERMTERSGANVHEVLSEVFRAMNVPTKHNGKDDSRYRDAAKIKPYANAFPYVNGELFSGSTATPKFNQSARNYLIFVGNLDWKLINPDIFGSMIQAVADDEERGALGMHYTSVPNILKVLNPLFLDDLRAKLDEAGDGKTPGSARKLLNLRNRLARIRVFDPACGSGNFLVIAYKEMRQIEAEINRRRGGNEVGRASEIPVSNFRGIELRDFPAEIARLALIIAEFQCDVLYRGELYARQEFLPLDAANWITCGNALQLDWQSVCPPTGTGVKVTGDDLFNTPLDQAEIDFENAGGETYICGNPPFTGTRKQTAEQKRDLASVFNGLTTAWKNVDYVGAWLVKASQYNRGCAAPFAFVATNSLCQGQQVPITWAYLLSHGFGIRFAFTPFKWSNLASNRAGVTVVIVGVDNVGGGTRKLFREDEVATVEHINPYLTTQRVSIVNARRAPACVEVGLEYGVYYSKSADLMLSPEEVLALREAGVPAKFFRKFLGSNEFINGLTRYCLWISDDDLEMAIEFPDIAARIANVRADRLATMDKTVNKLADRPHQFREFKGDEKWKLFVPLVSSESRPYFPAGLVGEETIATNKACYAPYAPLWVMAILVSRIHLTWIGTVCGRLEMRFSYSNTLGWNTFPVPTLTDENKAALTRCAEDILLAREAHFPATIADMYDPEAMDTKYPDLRAAHDRNDETLERIYIGRRFRNDTERLEKLFEMYSEMTAKAAKLSQPSKPREPGTAGRRRK